MARIGRRISGTSGPARRVEHFFRAGGRKLAAFDSYNSYCGRYEVKDGRIIHHVELSPFPNWVGGPQELYFEFSGDRLTLCAPETTPDGVERTWVATWQRATGR